MRTLIVLAFALMPAGATAAGPVYSIESVAKNYNARFTVDHCAKTDCGGKATIEIIDKRTKKTIQTLYSKDLTFFLDEKQLPTANVIELYGEQSPLIFDDFNFDGHVDVAVRNGNNSGYGGPSYDIYLYNQQLHKFMLSKALTQLASTNLGMYTTDAKRKRLITFTKDGCCWHQTSEYLVINNAPQAVARLIEDARTGDVVTVTTETYTNGKWSKRAKKYKTSDYYKDSK